MSIDENKIYVHGENPLNPYVHDPYHYLKHPKEGLFITSREFARWNYRFSGSLGFLFIALLLYLLIFRTPRNLKPYSRMLWMCCCADMFYLIFDNLCQTRLKMTDGSMLASNVGPVSYLSHNVQAIFIAFMCGGMTLCCTILPAQYYYRYCLIVKNQTLSLKQTLGLGLISFFAAMLVALVTAPSYLYSAWSRPEFDYGTIWYPEVPIPTLIISDICSKLGMVYFGIALIINFGAYVLTIWIYLKTMKVMKQSKTSNDKTQKLKNQFSRVLLIQAIVPLFTGILPITFAGISILLKVDTDFFGAILITALSWLPTLNSLATLILIPPYRKQIICLITLKCFCKKDSVQTFAQISSSTDSIVRYKPSDQLREQRG